MHAQQAKAYHATTEGHEEMHAQQAKAQKAEKSRQAAAARREHDFKQRAAERHNVDPGDITVRGGGRFTISTEARTVRKAQGGRPGYVALDLGVAGGTPARFCARNGPGQAQHHVKGTDDSSQCTGNNTETRKATPSDSAKAKTPPDEKTVVDLGQKMKSINLGVQ